MKTTDLAMIFVAIMLPIVIVVYVDVSFMLKTEEQRLYYSNVINSAINDATYIMKTVEGQEGDVDYGYSGLSEKKVTVNANVAIDTFFKSLYDNFEITNDNTSQEYIKSHIPAIAIIDYNGVYIYSMEQYVNDITNENYVDHVLKPKRYFTYSYYISGNEIKDINSDINNSSEFITVQFTMDDYITVIESDGSQVGFYLEDNNNNSVLYKNREELREKVIQHLRLKRAEIISRIISEEMSYAVNNHNMYTQLNYTFNFPTIGLDDWTEMVDNVGIIAFVQGINLGNIQLDYVAHGISGLKLTDRYYVSVSESIEKLNYYHSTEECIVYQQNSKPVEGYYLDKLDSATAGFYPCPVCKP